MLTSSESFRYKKSSLSSLHSRTVSNLNVTSFATSLISRMFSRFMETSTFVLPWASPLSLSKLNLWMLTGEGGCIVIGFSYNLNTLRETFEVRSNSQLANSIPFATENFENDVHFILLTSCMLYAVLYCTVLYWPCACCTPGTTWPCYTPPRRCRPRSPWSCHTSGWTYMSSSIVASPDSLTQTTWQPYLTAWPDSLTWHTVHSYSSTLPLQPPCGGWDLASGCHPQRSTT